MLRPQIVPPIRVLVEHDTSLRNLRLQYLHCLRVCYASEVVRHYVVQSVSEAFFAVRILFLEVSQIVSTVVQCILCAILNVVLLLMHSKKQNKICVATCVWGAYR